MGYSYGLWPRREYGPSNHVHRTASGMLTSEDIARQNIRTLTGGGINEENRGTDSPLTETLRGLAKRNMVSVEVRARIEMLLVTRGDALRWDTSPEGLALQKFAKDSVGIKSNADRAVNYYLDRLEQALDNPE